MELHCKNWYSDTARHPVMQPQGKWFSVIQLMGQLIRFECHRMRWVIHWVFSPTLPGSSSISAGMKTYAIKRGLMPMAGTHLRSWIMPGSTMAANLEDHVDENGLFPVSVIMTDGPFSGAISAFINLKDGDGEKAFVNNWVIDSLKTSTFLG